MEIQKDYKNDISLRNSFNALAEKTFGLNFENWYQTGYWQEKYIPYSAVENGKVIANVSVNIIDTMWNGKVVHLVQLGTVMTDEAYRNQGLIRQIMQEIDADFSAKADGMFLFANDEVLDFYPKFGYEKAKEYQYSKQVANMGEATIVQLPMQGKENWNVLETAIQNNHCYGQFDMINNVGLFMFYVTQFMQENVYYDEELNAYAIAEIEDDELLLHAVFAEHEVELERVILAFGKKISKVVLGFTPKATADYECVEIQEDDTTLFVKGEVFADFDKEKVMFMTLAHA